MGLTRNQLAVLHVAKKQLGLDDDCYRDVLESAAGVRSARDLTPQTFRSVMERFEELGFKGVKQVRGRRRARKPDPEALVTQAQLALLRHLFGEVGMDTLQRQQAFIRKVLPSQRSGWPQTRREASRVIETLKKMAGRGYDAGPRTS